MMFSSSLLPLRFLMEINCGFEDKYRYIFLDIVIIYRISTKLYILSWILPTFAVIYIKSGHFAASVWLNKKNCRQRIH